MLQVADLFGKLKLDISEFTSGLKSAMSEAKNAGKSISEAISSSGKGITNGLKNSVEAYNNNLNSQMKDTSRIIQGILVSQAFYQMTAQIKDAGKELFNYNADLEQTRIAFNYLLRSTKESNTFVNALQDFAAVTPFTTQSATAAAKQLMAMGFAANQVLPTLRILSDTTAVSGSDPEVFDRIVYAIGEIKSNGTVSMRQLRQLAQAGIPVFQILQEQLHLTSDQIEKIGKLKIPADQAISAILTGLQKRYSGAAAQVSKTTKGLLSTMKDDLLIIGNTMTGGMMGNFKSMLTSMTKSLENLRKVATNGGMNAVIKQLFPPEMQVQVRAFVLYLHTLGQEVGKLIAAFGPLASQILQAFMVSFNMCAPVLLGFIHILTELIQWLSSNTQAVRIFAFVLVDLMIANTVAKTITNLSLAVRGLAVVGPVANLVARLAQAIRLVALACIKNPIVAIVAVIAGVLLSLALSSKTASAWIDRLTASLGRLFGFNVKDLWKPINTKQSQADIDKYYKGLQDLTKGTDGAADAADKAGDAAKKTGKKAEDAGKKVKDKFVASFDELHQIPDLMNDIAKGMSETGDVPSGVDLGKMPDIPDLPADKMDNQQLPPFKWPNIPPAPIIPPIKLPKIPIKKWGEDLLRELQKAWEKIKELLRQPWPLPFPIPAPVLAPQWGEVKNKLRVLGNDVIGVMGDVATEAGHAADVIGVAIAGGLVDAGLVINPALDKLKQKVGEIGNDVIGALQLNPNPIAAATMLIGARIVQGLSTIPAQVRASMPSISTALTAAINTLIPGVHLDMSMLANAFKISIPNPFPDLVGKLKQGASDAMKSIQGFGSDVMGFISQHKVGVGIAVGAIVAVVIGILTGGIGDIIAGIASGGSGILASIGSIGSGAAAAVGSAAGSVQIAVVGVVGAVLATIAGIGPAIAKHWAQIKDDFNHFGENWKAGAHDIAEGIKNIFKGIGPFIAGALKSALSTVLSPVRPVIQAINAVIRGINGMHFTVPSWVPGLGGDTFGVNLPTIPALANGGIVTRDTLIRAGEGGNKEAVIPLQNPAAYEPLAQAIAAGLEDRMGSNNGGNNSFANDSPQYTIQCGILIADQRSLRELNRKLKVIDDQEKIRRG